jgi:hypothetical protein
MEHILSRGGKYLLGVRSIQSIAARYAAEAIISASATAWSIVSLVRLDLFSLLKPQ